MVPGMPSSQMIRSLALAVGVAAGAGAAQLGVGYGVGIFSWLPTVRAAGDAVGDAAWLASLVWTVWIFALSVVIGTVVADRVGLPTVGMPSLSRVLWRCVLVLGAVVGSLAVIGLVMIPARQAERSDTFAPHLLVGGYAIVGVLFGLVIAIVAVNVRPIAGNVLVTGAWLWQLAAVAASDAVGAGRDADMVRLGVWQFTSDGPWVGGIDISAAGLAGVGALLIGFFVAWPASGRIGAALSGAAGPLVLVGAYVIAAPSLIGAALYIVAIGLFGSVVAALLPNRPRVHGLVRPL